MPTIQKFQFDISFDEFGRQIMPEPEPEPEAEPAPPPEPTVTLTEAELAAKLAAARDQGYAAGHEAGTAAGREAAETAAQQALTEALGRVDEVLRRLLAAEPEARHRQTEQARELALAIVRKLFPALARQHGLAEVETTTAAFLLELAEEPKLVLRVHESRLEALRPHLEEMAVRAGFGGTLSLLADPRMGELDVRADWGDGAAERDVTHLWTEIERIAGGLPAGIPGGPAATAATARP
ncbi:hypothetical protein [Rhodocista pekingensis]|uniref:Flagellar assembly protein FliH n=1 Tax=Rhodocista pekingensis TaxID=201185 RepID=A0ABW2KP14_9PROT